MIASVEIVSGAKSEVAGVTCLNEDKALLSDFS
jgi:hypothetical protein